MDGQPTWLHNERSYRVYVRGLRYALIGFASALACGAVGASGVIGRWVPLAGVAAAFVLTFTSVLTGMAAWFLIPDKPRANADQPAFLRMVGHDLFRGLPSTKASG
ncbi:hypothetical protein ACQP2X_25730 [Actinoplanes sp. CA-131856]